MSLLRRFMGWLLDAPLPPEQPFENWIVVDGSNLMYWEGDGPSLDPVSEAVTLLRAKGFVPCVVFDANAGYLVSGTYQHNAYFAQALDLPEVQVFVVAKGEQADAVLLKAARQRQARVVSNDRFRDWAKTYPEVRARGHLVHGGYHKHKLWLDFDGSRERVGKTR